jgi:hypothetical protein
MNLQTIGNAILIILVIGWIGYRQTTWRPVAIGRMYRMGLILAVVGVALAVQAAGALTGLDIAVLLVEVVISLGIGAWMGMLARFRPLDASSAGSGGSSPRFESRTGWWGLALWLLVLAVRIVIDVVAVGMGARAATSAGVILLLVAANRIARTFVFSARLQRRLAQIA